ncbi:MAG: YggS family pyridoxal phosphate-dependent enzyme [Nitrospira sp.]|nr:YggS family pyridoxal phosphate-dependent enzyme [Nitrospira sp.]MDH4235634.1 YggS family pyridoxal phosphate-dependent enzyme [Nitrospira sp.]MDH5252088.1 YggS family pyridoxal phosphate-dependent enzyme [Nitrospira sp.]
MEPSVRETIAQRVQLVLSTIRSVAEKAGRNPDSIRLVAATKTVTNDRIREGIAAGLSILGENRVQEAIPKVEALAEAPVRWHFLGHLQRRKVRSVVGLFELIHSVDSVELAQEIDRRAGEAGRHQDILLEVNIGGETTKTGFHPDSLVQLVSSMASLAHIHIKGLMAIPPPTVEVESARAYFIRLRELAASIAAQRIQGVEMDELSMGMSNDYEIAIQEGATLVRVGSAIFGARHV